MTDGKKPTLIWSEIDYDKKGKQIGVLHLPYSVTRSGYGMINIPIAVIQNGEGPSVLLMAGNHGDEYEGQVTLARLIHDLETSDIQGRVIILPAANLPAAMAGARVSPLDSGNLNRAFPGEPDGTPTWQITHYIESVLLPICNAWVDLHSGGSSMDYLPFAAFYATGDDKALDARGDAMMRAFGAPRSVRVTAQAGSAAGGSRGSPAQDPLSRRGVGRHGLGQSRWRPAHAPWRAARTGPSRRASQPRPLRGAAGRGRPSCWNGAAMTTTPSRPRPGCSSRWSAWATGSRMASSAAMSISSKTPDGSSVPVHFKKGGFLICKRHFGRVEPGDCVAHTVTETVAKEIGRR